jgi:thiol-disulfide isomerase/thioredoxin
MASPLPDGLRAKAREILEHNARTGVRAPDFGADATWFNVSGPLSSTRDLSGKLLLVAFWTSSSIHCQHVLAELAWLERKYANTPLLVVGVHSAKFANEREPEHVRQAVLRADVEHPVVVDRDFEIWTRLAVRAWPTLVLVSPDGRILGQLAGEGQRPVLDALIEGALELYGELGQLDPRPLPLRSERGAQFEQALRFPGKVLADGAANRLWISDSGHHRVLECDLEGRFLRAFGAGEAGLVDGPAHEARFHGPQGLALHDGALYVADTLNHALRKIDLDSGEVATLAGDGAIGYERARELRGASARLSSPFDVLALEDRLLIAMAGAHQLWSYNFADGALRPVAGDGVQAHTDGAAHAASLAQPSGLARAGRRVVFADSESSSIRALDLESAQVNTLAGGAADPRNLFHFGDEDGVGPGRRFQHPLGVAVDFEADDERPIVYVVDSYNHKLKLLDAETGAVSAYAGDGTSGLRDGACESARFAEPGGASFCGDTLFVADTLNHAIRAVDLHAHEVRTLHLATVPLPAAPRAAADLGLRELPTLAATFDRGPRRVRLPANGGALELQLELEPGETLAQGAPSQFRALRIDGLAAARQVAGPIEADATRIELGLAGPGSLRVQALFYVRSSSGACRLGSHEWRVDVELDERAPARAVALRCEAFE